MKRIFMTLVVLMVLAGCNRGHESITINSLPQHLKNCTIDRLYTSSVEYITVVRCPNSAVTVMTNGKHKKTTTTITSGDN